MRKYTLADGKSLVQSRGGLARDARIIRALARNHVIDGLWVTAQSTPNQTVAISSGTAIVDGTVVRLGAGSLSAAAADSTYTRVDTIEVSSSGTLHYVSGTANDSGVAPVVSASGRIVIAKITRAAGDDTISDSDIDNTFRPSFDKSSITYRLGRRMS